MYGPLNSTVEHRISAVGQKGELYKNGLTDRVGLLVTAEFTFKWRIAKNSAGLRKKEKQQTMRNIVTCPINK